MSRLLCGLILSLFITGNTLASPIDRDIKIAYQNITNLADLIRDFEAQKAVFQKLERNSRISHQGAFEIKKLWGRIFDMHVTLNTLAQTYMDYHLKSADENAKATLIKYASTLALINSGARISTLLWEMPKTHKLLNEAHRDYPLGSLISLENQIFNMVNTTPLETAPPSLFPAVDIEALTSQFERISFWPLASQAEIGLQKIEAQESQIFKTMSKPFLTKFSNKFKVYTRYKNFKFKTVFTNIIAKVSAWLGDTKIKRRSDDYYNGKTYITLEQAEELEERLAPGDIMISRTNWFLSNAFLPGFWPHSFIYLGNLAKLKALEEDQNVKYYYENKCKQQDLGCDNFISYLKASLETSQAFGDYLEKAEDGFEKVLIEATSEGVHFSSIRHTFLNDFLAAMRPRLSTLEKAQAIEESMKFFGLPYDFDFDFDSHSSLVCSELVAKSFSSKIHFDYDRKNGLYVEKYLNRYSLPVIGIAQKMADENIKYHRPSELEFVGFLKAVPSSNEAIFASEREFYQSVTWPKWSFMQ